MEKEAREQLYHEERNWLNRGRTRLMESLLEYAQVRSGCGALLDIGAGSGHAIDTLAKYGPVDAIEIAPEAWPLIAKKPVRTLYKETLPGIRIVEKYNVIVGLEVLEHIEDEKAALQWISDHLVDGGTLVLTVPAYQWLFGAHDVANHHFRRYTRSRLVKALPPELTLIHSGYHMMVLFPLALIARIAYNIKSSVRTGMPAKQKSGMPAFIDKIFFKIMAFEAYMAGCGVAAPCGMTVYIVARKIG